MKLPHGRWQYGELFSSLMSHFARHTSQNSESRLKQAAYALMTAHNAAEENSVGGLNFPLLPPLTGARWTIHKVHLLFYRLERGIQPVA